MTSSKLLKYFGKVAQLVKASHQNWKGVALAPTLLGTQLGLMTSFVSRLLMTFGSKKSNKKRKFEKCDNMKNFLYTELFTVILIFLVEM